MVLSVSNASVRRWLVMARLARVEVFAADEIAIVHVMNRTVRLCFLLWDDPVSGQFDCWTKRRFWRVRRMWI